LTTAKNSDFSCFFCSLGATSATATTTPTIIEFGKVFEGGDPATEGSTMMAKAVK